MSDSSATAISRGLQLRAAVEALANGAKQIACVHLLTPKQYDHYLQLRVALPPADSLRRVLQTAEGR